MSIRKASTDDIPAIERLIEMNSDTLLPREREDLAKNINAFYVYELDNKRIAGCCCLEVYSPKIAEIRTVAVDTEFRLNGYGSELVKAAVADANKLNIREIMVVTSNPAFFEKLNFSTCLNEKYALFWDKDKK